MKTKISNDKLNYIYIGIVLKDLTIREVAKELNMARSTVHRYIHTYLKEKLTKNQYKHLCNILDCHFKFKYINGGKATKAKYEATKKE